MVENNTKDIKVSVYHGAVVSVLAVGLHNAWKSFNKDEPSISQ